MLRFDPDAINAQFGKPVWQCFGCKTPLGLHWWNGLSVAVCNKPECSQKYVDLVSRQMEEQEAFEAYCRENW